MNNSILTEISDKLYLRYGVRSAICERCNIGVNTLRNMVVSGNVTWSVLHRMLKAIGYHLELVKDE